MIKLTDITNEVSLINIDFNITEIENVYRYSTGSENWTHYPHPLLCNFLMYILDGEAYFNINGKEYTFTKDDIVYMKIGSEFFSEGRKGSFDYIAIHIFLENDIPDNILKTQNHSSNSEHLKSLFKAARDCYLEKNYAYNLKLKSYVYNILNHLITESATENKSYHKRSVIAPSIDYLERNIFNKELDMEVVAEQSGISSAYFRRIFKEIYKISPLKYVTEKRLERANELLYYKNFSINQIAEKIGYNYTVYFTKLFKEKYGVSPNKYKQNRQ